MTDIDLHPDRLLTRPEVVSHFGLSQRLLEVSAVRGDGPPMIKIGRSVRYNVADPARLDRRPPGLLNVGRVVVMCRDGDPRRRGRMPAFKELNAGCLQRQPDKLYGGRFAAASVQPVQRIAVQSGHAGQVGIGQRQGGFCHPELLGCHGFSAFWCMHRAKPSRATPQTATPHGRDQQAQRPRPSPNRQRLCVGVMVHRVRCDAPPP